MNHSQCREAIAFEDVEAATLAHLENCQACRSFADDMRRLEQLAVELAPQAPVDIVDRVLPRVQASITHDGTVVPLRRRVADGGWRAARDSFAVRLTSAAAVLVLIAGVVTTLQSRNQDPADIVLASAQSTADAGTAEVRVSAATDVVLTAPLPAARGGLPADPNFASAPVELRGQLEAQWRDSMARFEAQLRRFFQEVDRTTRDGTRQMDDAMRDMQRAFEESLRQFGDPSRRPVPPSRPRPPQPRSPAIRGSVPPQPQPPAPPSQVRARVVVDGHGTLDFNAGRMSLEGAVRAGGGRAPFALSAAVDGAVYRPGTDPWTRLPGRAGPLGAVVLDPQAILRIARTATDVTAQGTATLRGETVERYTFTVRGAATEKGRDEQPWRAAAYIGADGRMRRIEMASRGGSADGADVRTHLTMDLSRLGQASATAAPPDAAADTSLPARASLPLYPFNASVRAAQKRGDS